MQITSENSNRATFDVKAEVMLNSVPALIAYINKDLQYEFMNLAYERWFGVVRTACIGKTLREVLGFAAFEKLRPHLEKALQGTVVNFVATVPYLNGERVIDASYTPDFEADGSVRGITVLVNDVTQKNRIARELEIMRKTEAVQESENRYTRMIEGITDYSIILLDKDGMIENWNKGAEKIKGYKKHEIVGQHIRLFYVPEDREKKLPERLLLEALQNGRAKHEGWRLRKDGSVFWGFVIITALYDDNNNHTGFSKVTRDLTERKLAEDKLQQYARQLEYQNKELEQFAYIASHDLQEPLRKIRTFNERILQTQPLTEAGKDYFMRTISAATRMQRLIDDLLAYSRATNDPNNFDRVDLNVILNEIITSRRETIEENKIVIERDTLPVIEAIPFQISQLFDNLVSNAMKYRRSDRTPFVTIRSEILPAKMVDEKETSASQEYCHISVADNGIGFDPQYNEKIFEIFQRLHSQSSLPGSGIGLAICKKIVKNHNGFIRAEGIPDEGAIFHVYLPVSA